MYNPPTLKELALKSVIKSIDVVKNPLSRIEHKVKEAKVNKLEIPSNLKVDLKIEMNKFIKILLTQKIDVPPGHGKMIQFLPIVGRGSNEQNVRVSCYSEQMMPGMDAGCTVLSNGDISFIMPSNVLQLEKETFLRWLQKECTATLKYAFSGRPVSELSEGARYAAEELQEVVNRCQEAVLGAPGERKPRPRVSATVTSNRHRSRSLPKKQKIREINRRTRSAVRATTRERTI